MLLPHSLSPTAQVGVRVAFAHDSAALGNLHARCERCLCVSGPAAGGWLTMEDSKAAKPSSLSKGNHAPHDWCTYMIGQSSANKSSVLSKCRPYPYVFAGGTCCRNSAAIALQSRLHLTPFAGTDCKVRGTERHIVTYTLCSLGFRSSSVWVSMLQPHSVVILALISACAMCLAFRCFEAATQQHSFVL